jgi:sialate O-acetylesterase
MDFALSRSENAEEVAAKARDHSLRWFEVPKFTSDTPIDDFTSSWQVCRPDVAQQISAAAYCFARDLRKELKVPIGLIQAGLGGTRSEWWTGRRALEANPEFRDMLEADAKDPHRGHEHPAALYNGMIAPLQPYAIRGVIWYQGESNESDAYRYRIAFPTMIKSWRNDWGQGDFTFLFVQIAPYKQINEQPEDSDWAVVRESQLLTSLGVPNTAMTVITDCGDQWDIHPKKKEPAGVRLALAARALAYGQKVQYSGPVYKKMKIDGNRIVLSFSQVDGGLVSRNGELTGFAVAGEDRKFVWAAAKIQGDKVVVQSPQVARPVAVRYGWANYPVVNLFNKAGLPASPFRTDTWPVVTQP